MECPFCSLAAGGADEELLAHRTPTVLVLPAPRQRARNRGHALVVPTAHVTRMVDLPPATLQDLYATVARVAVAVRRAFDATGATLFQNEDAPDQVLPHMHVHVVPRRAGDDFRLPDPQKDDLTRAERRDQATALRRALVTPRR